MRRAYARKILLFFNIITYFFIFVKSPTCYWKCLPSVLINTRAFKKNIFPLYYKILFKKSQIFCEKNLKNFNFCLKKARIWGCADYATALLSLCREAYDPLLSSYGAHMGFVLMNTPASVTKSYKIVTIW